jgi:O-antigen ligase
MIFFYIVDLFSAVPKHPLFGDQIGGGGITVIKIVGFLAFLSAGMHCALQKRFPPLFRAWQTRLFIILSGFAFISYLALGNKTDFTMSPFMSYISYVTLLFATVALVDTPARFRYTVLAFIGAPAIAAVYTLREWEEKGFRAGARPGYVAGDANYYAANAILGLALAYFLFQTKRPTWERVYSLCCAGLIIIAMVASESRGGFFALCLSGTYVFIRSKRKLQLMGFGLVIAVLLVVSPSSPIRRLVHPNSGDTKSEVIHKELWVFGLEEMVKHPIMGVGLGNFKPTVAKDHALGRGMAAIAHNTYIEYGAEMGIPGLLLFLGIIVFSWKSLERVRNAALRTRDEYFYAVSSGMQTGILGYCVAAFFLSAEYLKTLWIMIFLTAILPTIFLRAHTGNKFVNLRERSVSQHETLALSAAGRVIPRERESV